MLPVPLTRLYVQLSPASGSDVENVPTAVPTELFSGLDAGVSEVEIGVSFTLMTVTTNVDSVDRPWASVERIRI